MMGSMANNWEHYQSFLAVIETGSLSAAAKRLGLSQPTIGRHVDALEAAVGAPLFVRSRYGLNPTDTARGMVSHAKTMAIAANALKRAAAAQGDAAGKVRLTASQIIGGEVLPAIISDFVQTYPHIHVELVLTNRTENLLKREADIAIRMRRPIQEALIARKIGDVPLKLYAHRDYIVRKGTPSSLDDIEDHIIIGPESMGLYADFTAPIEVEQLVNAMNVKCDSDLAQLALVRAGCGIGGVQMQLATREEDLLPVLHDMVSIPMEMWLVAHEDMLREQPVRLFFDHLAKHLLAYAKYEKP